MRRRAQPWAYGRDLCGCRCLVLALYVSMTLLPRTCDADHDGTNNTGASLWEAMDAFWSDTSQRTDDGFTVVSGDCFISSDTYCVRSPGWPRNYSAGDRCAIHVEKSGYAEVEAFYAAGFRGVDGLRVDGQLYSGTGDGLQGLRLSTGTAIFWETSVLLDAFDISRMGNQSNAGFSICLAGDDSSDFLEPSDEPTGDEQPGYIPPPPIPPRPIDYSREPRFRKVSGNCNISYQQQDRELVLRSSWPQTVLCWQGAAADVDGCILEAQVDTVLLVKSLPRIAPRLSADGTVVWVNGVGYSRRDELHGLLVSTGSTVSWSSSALTVGNNISICEGWTPPPLRRVRGACEVSDGGHCVTSPYWPQKYRDNMLCAIAVDADMLLDVRAFDTEQNYDVLTITRPTGETLKMSGNLLNGSLSTTFSYEQARMWRVEPEEQRHRGWELNGDSYIIPAGSRIEFETDYWLYRDGFHLCSADPSPSPPSPSPPSSPLPPLPPPPPPRSASSRSVLTLSVAVGASLALVLGAMIALCIKRRMRTGMTPTNLLALIIPSNSSSNKRSTNDTIMGLTNTLLTIDIMLASKMPMSPITDLAGFDRLRSSCSDQSLLASSSNVVRPAPSETSSLQSGVGPGEIVAGYECIAVMTRGAVGACYLVRHLAQGGLYVLKVPKMGTHTQSSVTEAYLAALLNHTNVVRHHQTFIHHGTLVVASEYCGLGDLQTLIDAAIHLKFKFTTETVVALLVNLCKGVAWMHQNSVAHRDIKPENVFLDSDGVPKLGDLGSCRFMLETSTSFVGTPLYMAPEVLTHQPHSTKLDIWSLGLVIYQMCTLKVPFPADSVDALKDKVLQLPPPIPTDEFPAELVQLVSQMMAVDPVQRPSAAELLAVPWVAQLMMDIPKMHTILKTQATSILLKWKQQQQSLDATHSQQQQSLDATHSLSV